jgi:tRNA(fMet)-specific endonuclease VapC
MGFLLDTNIASDLIRNPQGRVARRIDAVGADDVCTSIVVAAELRFGAARGASARIAGLVEGLLMRLTVLPLESPADSVYGGLRTQLERAGTPIGPNDLLIAAHALALGHTLVTDNVREFSRVKGLAVENWLR